MAYERVKPTCLNEIINLSFQIPAMRKANSHRETPIEMCFKYFGNKEIHCVLKDMLKSPTLCYFTQNAVYFIISYLSVRTIFTFFRNRTLKFKYRPRSAKGYISKIILR